MRVALGAELEVLLDIPLQQRRAERRPRGCRPGYRTQRLAGGDDRNEDQRIPPRAQAHHEPQQAAERHRDEGEGEYAAERRIALQRPAERRIARRKPRESSEQPGAQPFEKRPRGGYEQRRTQRRRRGNARLQPAGGRGEEREKGAQAGAGERGERRRHAAETRHADVDPGDAGAEKAKTERPADPERAPGRAAPNVHEKGKGDDFDGVCMERRESENRYGTGEKSGKGVRPLFFFHAFGLSTSRVYTRRLSARRTWKRTPSMPSVSPRLGSRPRCEMTSPPTVSAASSENFVPSALLRSAICVSALTR